MEPGSPVGGVQAAVEILAHSLVDLGVDVVVIDPFTGHRETTGTLEVVRLPALPPWRMGSSGAPRELCQAVAAAQADILHVHLGMQFCKLHWASVATVHGFPHLESQLRHPGWRGQLAATALRRPFLKGLSAARKIISISEEVTRIANQAGVPSVRIPNPISRDFLEVNRVPGSDFVAIGDILRGKNQRMLIDGFAGFVRAGGVGDLLIIGGVGDAAYLADCLVAAEPLGNRVRFLGPRRRDEVLWFLARAKASVSTSLRETSSIAIAEALAANCPILTLDVGTAREQIGSEPEFGSVLPVASTPSDVTQALIALADRPVDINSLRSRVADQHPTLVAKRTLEVYQSLLT